MKSRALGLAWGLLLLSGCEEGVPVHSSAPALRPDHPDAIEPRYPPGTRLESVVSPGGAFRVHFTREGADRIPGAVLSTPTYALEVGRAYDLALAHYEALAFRAPLGDEGSPEGDGGDALHDVYLVDFFGRGDGQFRTDDCAGSAPRVCVGHFRHENDFAGSGYPSLTVAHRILATHELFHGVQAAYSTGEPGPLSEGTAVWATETFDPSLGELAAFAPAFLRDPGRSLETDGGFDGWIYGAGLFFQFLDEAYGRDLIRLLWEARGVPGRPEPWLETLDGLLRDRGSDFASAFSRFARWNLALGVSTSEETYARAFDYPPPAARSEGAPVMTGRLRIFPASMRLFEVPMGDRVSVYVSLVGEPADLEDLVVVAGWRAGSWAPTVELAAARPIYLERSPGVGSGGVWIAIVDPRVSGSSRRPVLCAGARDEHDACVEAATRPGDGEADAGVGDGGGGETPDIGPDAGVRDASTEGSAMPGSEGCREVGARGVRGGGFPILAVLLGLGAFWGRRRR